MGSKSNKTEAVLDTLRGKFSPAVSFEHDAGKGFSYSTGPGTHISDHAKFRALCNQTISEAFGKPTAVF